MATEQFGDIVIAPRVLEKIIAIATAKVEGTRWRTSVFGIDVLTAYMDI